MTNPKKVWRYPTVSQVRLYQRSPTFFWIRSMSCGPPLSQTISAGTSLSPGTHLKRKPFGKRRATFVFSKKYPLRSPELFPIVSSLIFGTDFSYNATLLRKYTSKIPVTQLIVSYRGELIQNLMEKPCR